MKEEKDYSEEKLREHYDKLGITPNEYLESIQSGRTDLDAYTGYLQGQVIKYTSRLGNKENDPLKDAVKVQYYSRLLYQHLMKTQHAVESGN